MSRCTGMWKVRVSAGVVVKDVEIKKIKRANCEWIHREMPTEISSKVSSYFTSSGPGIKVNTDCSEYRISSRQISERKSPSSAKNYYWWALRYPNRNVFDAWGSREPGPDEIRSWHWNVAKWVLGGHLCKRTPRNRWAQTRARFASLNLHQEPRESCVQMHWRGRQTTIRSCIISLTVNSFLFSMERQQLFLGLFAVFAWLLDGSAC